MATRKQAAAAAAARRKKSIQGTGLGRLVRTLEAKPSAKAAAAKTKKNRKGITVPTDEEAKRVAHRLSLKYPKDYPEGKKIRRIK
jgi:nucleotidyltransferase/DNA polymerase involved in DNA repair